VMNPTKAIALSAPPLSLFSTLSSFCVMRKKHARWGALSDVGQASAA